MFDLSTRERSIILFLAAVLLIGLAIMAYQKSNSVVDVKIKAFDHGDTAVMSDKININEAGIETLTRLQHIGPSLAKRIVEYRNEVGRFTSIEDIKKVKGIGDKLFDRIKDDISIE
jgi:comEA protein